MTPTTTSPDTDSRPLDRPAWLTDDSWPFTVRSHLHRRADDSPLDIHYTDEGEGPVLVLLHAGMWSFIWRDAIAGLSTDHRCISLDFPGAGLSRGTPADVDLAAFPDIVNGLLDRRGIEKATFVCHDLGGVVGVTAADRRPDRVRGLVAANAFAWPPDRAALKMMLAVMGSRFSTATLGSARLVPRMTKTGMGAGRHYSEADRTAFFGPYRSRTRSRNFHRAMRSARRSASLFVESETALETTLADKPLLTIFGEKNDQFGFADRWRSYLPDATGWTVDGGHHFPMCDEPDQFADRIRQWHRSILTPHRP